jgi:hypothetical protein
MFEKRPFRKVLPTFFRPRGGTHDALFQEEIAATGAKNGSIAAIPAFTVQVFKNVVLKGLNHDCLIYEHYKSESAADWH